MRRPTLWGGTGPGTTDLEGGDEDDEHQWLPAAAGVPSQTDWVCVHGNLWSPADCLCDLANVLRYHKDPVAQLQKLAREQSELLLRKLGGGGGDDASAPGPSGSGWAGDAAPPTRSPQLPFGSEGVRSTTYVAPSTTVLSPRPVKLGSPTGSMRTLLQNEQEVSPPPPPGTYEEPSYRGPGAAFEKGEDVPPGETPAPPTEEELDVLET